MTEDEDIWRSTGSNKRFDFLMRCRFGKRPALGFVQSDPFIHNVAQLSIDRSLVAAV